METQSKIDLLVNKLNSKYNDDESPELSSYIDSEVSKVLNNGRRITATDIATIEKKVQRRREALFNMDEETRAKEATVLPSERSKMVSEAKAQDDNAAIPGDSYIVFLEANKLRHEKEVASRKEREYALQQKLKSELDSQISNRGGGDELKAIDNEYAKSVNQDVQKWQEEEKLKQMKAQEKMHTIQAQRDAQIQDLKRRQANERELTRREGQRIIDNAKAELQKEEERRQQRALESKLALNKIMEDNKKTLDRKKQYQDQLREEDKILQAQAIAKLDEQERQRAATYAKMKAKSEGNQKMYSLAVADARAKEEADEERARQFQLEKIRQDEEKAEAKLRKQEEDRQKLSEYLGKQVQASHDRKHQFDYETELYAKAYKEDAERGLELERQKADARKKAGMDYVADLRKQIEEKKTRADYTDVTSMTAAEKKLNAVEVQQLLNDPELVDSIKARVEAYQATQDVKTRVKNGQRAGARDLQDQDLLN